MVTRSHSRKRAADLVVEWIPGLAEPYLRGYAAKRETRGGLLGYWFFSPASGRGTQYGFFLGYLMKAGGWKFLQPMAPECVAFAFVLPVGGKRHRELVTAPDSLLRSTFEYIRWLTHRPPRFQLYERATPALIRHIPLSAWPASRIEHYSRNFFIETLAWLVRSALVKRLAGSE